MADKVPTEKELCDMMKSYCATVAKPDNDKLSSKVCKDMGKQCWDKHGDKKRPISEKMDNVFAKVNKGMLTVNPANMKMFFTKLAADLGVPEDDLKKSLKPKEVTKAGGSDAVTKRLTDTKQYTGAHKERFDADGKGKGLEGRETKTDTSGYVNAYKDKGTFDSKKK